MPLGKSAKSSAYLCLDLYFQFWSILILAKAVYVSSTELSQLKQQVGKSWTFTSDQKGYGVNTAKLTVVVI